MYRAGVFGVGQTHDKAGCAADAQSLPLGHICLDLIHEFVTAHAFRKNGNIESEAGSVLLKIFVGVGFLIGEERVVHTPVLALVARTQGRF